jgi:outer membrane receptor protein involved in Fe transport
MARRVIYLVNLGANMIFRKNSAPHLRRAGLVFVATASFFAAGADAQTPAPTPAQSAKEAAAAKVAAAAPEEVVITGSRVRRTTVTTPTPLSVISTEKLRFSGYTSIGAVLNQLTQAQPTTNPQNTGNTLFAAGQNNVDIRGLGSARTLVLINGKRHQAGSFTGSAVDLNSFATNYVDRVEVITGGASAAYGSEAISGVVNIQTRKDLDGIELSTQGGIAAEGDGSSWNVALTAGHHYLNDRAYSILAVETTKEEPILQENRDYTNANSFQYNTNVVPNVIIPRQLTTSVSRGGVFRGLGVVISTDRTKLDPIGVGCRAGEVGCTQTTDFPYTFIYAPLNAKLRRTLINSYNEYKFSDHLKGTIEYEYSGVVSKDARSQPTFNTAQRIFRDNGFLAGTDALATSLRNAFDAAGLRNPGQSTTAGFFYDDIGQRILTQKRYGQRLAVGLDGDFNVLNRNLKWDAYYTYGQQVGTTYGENQYILDNFANAIDSIVDPTTRNVVCRSVAARAAGCVPYDFIHGPSQAAVNYVRATNTVYGRLNQNVAAINLSTDLLQLPAGPLGIAVGAEYRNEYLSQTFDPLTVAGALFTNQRANVIGQFNVKEAYAEAVIPILKDLPGVKYLGAEVAGRTANYSTAGYANSYKLGGEYAPTEDVRFRATTARSLRAPNLFELFSPLADNFTTANDPCDRRIIPTAPDPVLRTANCIALIRPNLPGYNPLTFSSGNQLSSTHLLQGGNPNLSPEQGITFSAGAVVTPRWIPNLTLAADYFTVTVRGAISTLGTATTYNFCYDQPGNPLTNPYCALITRDFTGNGQFSNGIAGTISAVKLVNLNLARFRTSGIDYEATYRFDAEPMLDLVGLKARDAGDVSLKFNATNTQTYTQQGNPAAVPLSFENVLGTPRWNVTGSATWSNETYGFTFSSKYLSDQKLNNTQNPTSVIPFYYKAYLTHSATIMYKPTDYLTARMGVTNLFDRAPPITVTGTTTAGSQYENRGRYLFAGATVKY